MSRPRRPRPSICWACALGRCGLCRGCSCTHGGTRASLARPVSKAFAFVAMRYVPRPLVMFIQNALVLVLVAFVCAVLVHTAHDGVTSDRPASATEMREHQIEQQTAELFADMEAQKPPAPH